MINDWDLESSISSSGDFPPLTPTSSSSTSSHLHGTQHFIMMNNVIEDNTENTESANRLLPPPQRHLLQPPQPLNLIPLPMTFQQTQPSTPPIQPQQILQLHAQLHELTHWVERGGGQFQLQLQAMKEAMVTHNQNFQNLTANLTPEGWRNRVEEALTSLV
jgi:hypothetical protein